MNFTLTFSALAFVTALMALILASTTFHFYDKSDDNWKLMFKWTVICSGAFILLLSIATLLS